MDRVPGKLSSQAVARVICTKDKFMLRSIKQINGDKLRAYDGRIGHVKDFYFDDKHWTVRYAVADTGS
jgi:hypothetical protein